MKQFQIAVVDDSEKDREWLADTLAEYMNAEGLEYTLSSFSCGEEFLPTLKTDRYDVVFMDVYMGNMTGVDTAQALRIRDQNCKLVFLTISEDHMRQGFALNSAHYLIKPVKKEDFEQAMKNCKLKQQAQIPVLSIVLGAHTLQVDTTKLCYVTMEERTVMLYTTSGVLKAGRSFSFISQYLLKDRRFLLCNKALLVNMDYINSYEGDYFYMSDSRRLPIALRRKQDVLAKYRNYIFGGMGGIS